MDRDRDAQFVLSGIGIYSGEDAYQDVVARSERIAAAHGHPVVTLADVDDAIVDRIAERRTGNVPPIHRDFTASPRRAFG